MQEVCGTWSCRFQQGGRGRDVVLGDRLSRCSQNEAIEGRLKNIESVEIGLSDGAQRRAPHGDREPEHSARLMREPHVDFRPATDQRIRQGLGWRLRQ